VDLTPENKAYIDNLSYEGLLRKWRFAPAGDSWFQGETGDYWSQRMRKLKESMSNDEYVAASKKIGW
jgi:hypothetical protein